MDDIFLTRRYEEGDETEIIKILKQSFSIWEKTKKPLEKWRWKYLDTPLGTDIVVATHEGKIIGVTHNLLFHLKLGPSIILTHFGADSATHLEHRGKGVFGKIIELIEIIRKQNHVRFEYAISTNPAVRKVWSNRGRTPFPFKVSYMLKVKNVERHFSTKKMENSTLLKCVYAGLKTANRINRTNKTTTKSKEFEIKQIKKFDDKIDTFWDTIKGDYNFILEKNSKYLNWRYCDPRGGNFTVFQATQGDKILGFLALQLVEDNGYVEGFITDLLTLPRRTDVANALIEEVNNLSNENDINAVYYMVVKSHPYQKTAIQNGYVDCKQVSFITCHVIDVENEFEILKTSTPRQVYFNYGDLF